MTKREQVNRARCIAALQKHWPDAYRGSIQSAPALPGAAGALLYGLLDAAVGRLKPSQADAARSNALQFLRRRARAAAKAKGKKSPSKQRRGAAYHNRSVRG